MKMRTNTSCTTQRHFLLPSFSSSSTVQVRLPPQFLQHRQQQTQQREMHVSRASTNPSTVTARTGAYQLRTYMKEHVTGGMYTYKIPQYYIYCIASMLPQYYIYCIASMLPQYYIYCIASMLPQYSVYICI